MLLAEYLKTRVGTFEVTLPRLAVGAGEIHCLVGRSGSGKSTALMALAGFAEILQGGVRYGDRELTGLPPEKRETALVFQRSALFPHLTVAENVAFGLRARGVPAPERRARVEEWLERLGVAELADRLPSAISVGQGQRVALARALAVGFPVLLLDEPFASLDPASRAELRGLLKAIVRERKIAAVLVTHSPEDVVALADEVTCLSEGKLMWTGKPENLNLDDPAFRETLFGAAHFDSTR